VYLAEVVKLLVARAWMTSPTASIKRVSSCVHGAFRDAVSAKVDIELALPPGRAASRAVSGQSQVQDRCREVEFGDGLYAKLKFPPGGETERFASSPKAVGVYAEVAGNTVKLNRDSSFGLLAITNAKSPSLTQLYRSKEDDSHIYASVERRRREDLARAKAEESQRAGAEEERIRFYSAVKHKGV